MLILATFIPICMAAVFFLLRFLVALNSEIRSARKPSAVLPKRHSIYRLPSVAGANASVPTPVLVHSNSGLALRGCTSSFDSCAKGSQLKGA
jgi:hypothetical protein